MPKLSLVVLAEFGARLDGAAQPPYTEDLPVTVHPRPLRQQRNVS